MRGVFSVVHHHDLRSVDHAEFVFRERVYAPGMRMPRHAHDYSNVTVIINGEIEEEAEEGRYGLRPAPNW